MIRRRIVWIVTIAMVTILNARGTTAGPLDVEINIPYQKFVLKNGLTLLVHEDHKAPIVAVNVWYHVGSKNEKLGKTGFAHLFEHLMFNGSENYNDDYFKPLEPIGATDMNGTTSEDRTNYFQNVPTAAFDLVLWLESDRMGHLVGAIDQAKLDEQRGVVQNEKRQGENEPYGKVDELITQSVYPKGHPYSWTVIGSMEDLNAANLDDVKQWFADYYGAANAVLSIAGDVDTEDVKARVEKFFGDIPSGPPVSRYQAWTAKRTGSQRQVTQDRVPQARIYKVWNVPQLGTEEGDYLDLVSDVLASGKTSRFFKRLVYEDQIATNVSAYIMLGEIAGTFQVVATAKPGEDLAKVEKALDEEMDKFLKSGPSEDELERVKINYVSNFVRGVERIGGFGGKSDILAENQVFCGDPDHYKVTLERIKNATKKNLLETARNWLSDGDYILEVHPFPEYQTMTSNVNRSNLPEVGDQEDAKFPDFKRVELTNGMKMIVAERHTVPVVQFRLLLDSGYASDQFTKPGIASLAMNMMDEGTRKLDALEISQKLDMLGASLGTGSSLDTGYVTLSTLKTTLDDALEIYVDGILNPSFPENEFQRLQKEQLAAIQRDKVTPIRMALRVFPKLLYGEGHAYSYPLTGNGTEVSVSSITVDELKQFHQSWFMPNHATLIVVGDTTLDEIKPKIEKAFKDWQAGEIPQKNLADVQQKEKPQVYVIDRPDSLQSLIFAGHVSLPKANPHEIALEALNYNLGGAFTSRINMNLREDKHWSYGAGSIFYPARGDAPFLVYTSVQTDKTSESMQEIQKELSEIMTTRPITSEEMEASIHSLTLQLPGSWETMSAIASSLADLVNYGYPDDYYQTYSGRVKALQISDTVEAAQAALHPNRIVWVVVGDRKKIAPGIEALGYGAIQYLDADGNPVQ